ncbi:MAG TPA: FmdB family zinc ribbon protein [Thermomicrobiales bacterium]|nr:FmdB family zinc ribbon protein [Thermomicrobiales bacterium]
MPNYVYRGTDCPHEFEVHQSFSEDPLTECTVCGQPVRRVFQPTGLVFKGSGWYINDSRKSGSKDGANSTPPAKAESTPAPSEKKAKTTATKEPATAGASKD